MLSITVVWKVHTFENGGQSLGARGVDLEVVLEAGLVELLLVGGVDLLLVEVPDPGLRARRLVRLPERRALGLHSVLPNIRNVS